MVEAADLIWECWNNGRTISMVPEQLIPETRREAYAIQSHYLSKTDYPCFGWKIAATSIAGQQHIGVTGPIACLLYTSPSPRDLSTSRMPSSA